MSDLSSPPSVSTSSLSDTSSSPFAITDVSVPCCLTKCSSSLTLPLQNVSISPCQSCPSFPSNPSHHYIFVYGTLKRGFCNHYNISSPDIHYLCSAVTSHKFPLYIDPLNRYRPCLVNIKGVGHRVRGELYEVTTKQLEALDIFERVPNHYHRQLLALEVVGEEGEKLTVWGYVYFINAEDVTKRCLIENEERKEIGGEEYCALLEDYTFDHHSLYVSRKQLEMKEKIEVAKNVVQEMVGKVEGGIDMSVTVRGESRWSVRCGCRSNKSMILCKESHDDNYYSRNSIGDISPVFVSCR